MSAPSLLDPSIFANLSSRLEEESEIRDALTQILQRLERSVGAAQGLLTKVHSTQRANYPQLTAQLEVAIKDQVAIVAELDALASKHPYYKYNSRWSRTMQTAISTVLYTAWLGGFSHLTTTTTTTTTSSSPTDVGHLLTLDQVGAIFAVPTNLKDRDAFHLTIEEYLLALIDLTQELSRLATNAVTLGDFALPLVVSAFLKDLFAGFQLLNLKNDILRKRADAVKYDVKRVEDVVYDLSLRALIPRPGPGPLDAQVVVKSD